MVSTAPRRASLTCKLKRRARALRFSTIGMLRPRILTSIVSPRARLSLLSIFTLPTTAPVPPDSAGGTLAQGLRGARASALGSQSEDPRQDPAATLMSPHEMLDFRCYFRAEARSVKDAVMAHSGLQMVLTLTVWKILAQNMCSIGLADPRDVVLFPFHCHEGDPVDFSRVYQCVAVRHHPAWKAML